MKVAYDSLSQLSYSFSTHHTHTLTGNLCSLNLHALCHKTCACKVHMSVLESVKHKTQFIFENFNKIRNICSGGQSTHFGEVFVHVTAFVPNRRSFHLYNYIGFPVKIFRLCYHIRFNISTIKFQTYKMFVIYCVFVFCS